MSRAHARPGRHRKEPDGASAGRRISLVTFDQVLSSISNLLALVLVAHALAPEDFGRFSLLFVGYTLAQAAVRSLVSMPAMVHPEDSRHRPQVALGAAVLLGGAISLVCISLGAVMMLAGQSIGSAVLTLGVCLAPLLLQDVGRYVAFGRGEPQQAIVLDTAWLVLLIAGFAVEERFDLVTLDRLVIAWAASGAVSGLWVFVRYGVPTGRDLSLDWIRRRWDFSWRSLVGNFFAQSVGLLGAIAAAAVSTASVVAAVRASLLLGRPSATVQLGVATSTAADVAREEADDEGLRRHQRRALGIAAAVATLNLGILLVLPDFLGRALLGQVWPIMEPLVLPAGLFGLVQAAQTSISAVLIGRRQMATVMRVDILGAMIGVACLVGGARLGQASGAVWGTVVGQGMVSAIWVVIYLRHLSRSAATPVRPDTERAVADVA
ncbi:hypothetical protein [Nocardioides sp. Kera G14]|uniref:hypothetical protein n=1 Tax=Nocardioides sp. Kera G14 TaxID=2884264 RepID=UPI001D0F511C|nr:hypothetical protein [Nocardioides sp. Kera G14]UDY23617.1 hypothetical protein LH076_16390 [Nocardioides sp. Kera G14]